MNRALLRNGAAALALTLLSGVTVAGFSLPAFADGGSTTAAPQGQMNVLTSDVYPGGTIKWTATGLTPNATLDLDWQTISGQWIVDGDALGTSTEAPAVYTYGSKQVATVQTSSQGSASGSFAVPSGFGGAHNFQLTDASGDVEAVGAVTIWPSATISTTTEPQGGFFTIRMVGMSATPYSAQFGVLYDDKYMGYDSAVSTEGTAVFQVRAEGVGKHQISLRGAGVLGPYLNQEESPYPLNPRYYWNVTVTKATPKTVVDPEPATVVPAGKNMAAIPTSGTVGSTFELHGYDLTANTQYTLVWNTMSGNRVTNGMYQTAQNDLASVTTDANGQFTWKGQVPDDLGGPPHEIDIEDSNQTVVGSAYYRIMPKYIDTTPNPAPEGSLVTVHLTGVGWTNYDNIYAVDYDNGFMGYACGFNSHGDVHIQVPAVGGPGYHFIDIYPSPYMGSKSLPNWYGMPQLTYAKDHPGDTLPAFHIVIDVQ